VSAPSAARSAREPLAWGATAIGLLLLLWWLATAIPELVPPRVLPSPFDVVRRFFALAGEPFSGATLLGHAVVSLQRWGIGVLAAIALGLPLGIALAWLPPLRAVVTPGFELMRYIPPFAWVPIAVLWFGATTTTQAAIVFIAAFPACIINTQLAVAEVDPILARAARTLGAGAAGTLAKVILPVAAPTIFTGLRIAFSNGWMALVGAELVVGKQGLGFLISQGQINDSASTILVGMTTIGVLGTLIDAVLQRAQRLVLPWRPVAARPTE
jgi:ABC-type nitrate/sulfonate/bicarbonate transport system permease component